MVLALVMRAVQHRDGVGQQVGDGVERVDRAFRAAGQIQNDGFAANAGGGAGENGARSFLDAGGAHLLGETGDQAIGNGDSCFGRDVARAEAGAAGGEDQVDRVGIGGLLQERFDGGAIVGQHGAFHRFPFQFHAALQDGWAGAVFVFSVGDGVAQGEDGNAHGDT